MPDACAEIWHATQEREQLVHDLTATMNQIGSHLDEIRNLQTQYDMLVRANASACIRLSVCGSIRLLLPSCATWSIMSVNPCLA